MFDPFEFGFSLAINNRLAAERAAGGGAIELGEIVDLMASSQSLYDLATLCAREMGRVCDVQELWASMGDLFAELGQAWENVPGDGGLIPTYRSQLERLKERSEDRKKMFVVTTRERLKHAADRADSGIETTRATRSPEPEPDGWRDTHQGHVYSVGRF